MTESLNALELSTGDKHRNTSTTEVEDVHEIKPKRGPLEANETLNDPHPLYPALIDP